MTITRIVLCGSMKVKDDYPDYRTWYQTIQIPGIYNGTRNIIIAHIKERIVGFISLKKTSEEKKICTFYVEKNFRRNKIGMLLAAKAVEYLEEDKPLITIPLDKLNEFAHIAAKYDWQISDIKENLYRLQERGKPFCKHYVPYCPDTHPQSGTKAGLRRNTLLVCRQECIPVARGYFQRKNGNLHPPDTGGDTTRETGSVLGPRNCPDHPINHSTTTYLRGSINDIPL